MPKSIISLQELNGHSSGVVHWDVTLPEYINPNKILVHDQLVERVANYLGSNTLQIATEETGIKHRVYGRVSDGYRWSTHDISDDYNNLFRVVEADAHEGDDDWVVINLSEVQDNAHQQTFKANTFNRLIGSELIPDYPHEGQWAGIINKAIKGGFRELAKSKAGHNPVKQVREVAVATTTMQTLVYSPNLRKRKIRTSKLRAIAD